MSERRFNPRSFVGNVTKEVSRADASLDWLIEAHLWSSRNLCAIHKFNPQWEQRWLVGQIRRIFNIDVNVYIRTCKKIGGGISQEQFSRGRDIVKRFGVYETFRAEKLLTQEQLATIPDKVNGESSPDEFRAIVDAMAEEKTPAGEIENRPAVMDYRREYIRLYAENATLKKELQLLRDQLARYELCVVRKV